MHVKQFTVDTNRLVFIFSETVNRFFFGSLPYSLFDLSENLKVKIFLYSSTSIKKTVFFILGVCEPPFFFIGLGLKFVVLIS